MILYIIRHAIAIQTTAPPKPGQPSDDSQRPLTNEGRKKMRRTAEGLKTLGVQLDVILSSPYLRATQTARILARTLELGRDKVILTEHLTPVGDQAQLISAINEADAAVPNIGIVGHEPSLRKLISTLVSGEPTLSVTVKKGGVCRLSVDSLHFGRCATLDWLLWPAQLTKIGG